MKPILFNTEMVRALMDGRKTVTRRVIKGKDIINGWDCEADGTPIAYIDQATGDSYPPTAPAPYNPGDVLWVRETFFREECTQDCAGRLDPNECPFNRVGDSCYGYKTQYIDSTGKIKWRPSIHMPKEAARLFLRVTGVRVERLRDMDADDAAREGVHDSSEGQFAALWDSTIKPADLPRYGWEANPWVWVIEFERISKEAALGGGQT